MPQTETSGGFDLKKKIRMATPTTEVRKIIAQMRHLSYLSSLGSQK